ncbi:MAG: M13-type metalloendopeptidase [Pseudomonadota bacterium]
MNRLSIAVAVLVSCATPACTVVSPADNTDANSGLITGLDPNGYDQSVRPQDNLFQFVNGRWLTTTDIPDDKSNYGSFSMLADQSDERLRSIIVAAAESEAPAGSEQRKIGDFYRAFMDIERIEALGVDPVRQELARIDNIRTRRDLAEYLGSAARLPTTTPIRFWVGQDYRNPSEYLVNLTQSGLGLPDRDYYLTNDAESKSLRDAYLAYLEQLLSLAGRSAADRRLREVLYFETELARAQWSRTDSRDRDKTYNKVSATELAALLVGIDVTALTDAAGLGEQTSFNIRQPSYFERFSNIAMATPLDVWKTYLSLRLLNAAAPYLSTPFADAHFDFNRRRLKGVQTAQPRWKRAVQAVDTLMGQMVGRLYVEQHFLPEAKARMDELVANLLAAFEQGINELDWMSPVTKQEARAKLARFNVKIGYPDVWPDYSELYVDANALYDNVVRAVRLDADRQFGKLGGPVDRDEWFMSPQTVNAYYNPSMNEIVFPAAILQPPFFDVRADDAVNYGAIGAVIGHEISHGFDDQGRKTDGNGVLRNWWTASDNAEFTKRADGLVEQYNRFEPLPGKFVNGRFTLGENIGDLSGVAVAYKAYQQSLNGAPGPVIDGYTAAQRFFMGYAQVWRRKYRDSELERRLLVDPHSPAEYRVNGIVRNIDAFYDAYGVDADDALYLPPEERVRIW